MGHVIAIHVKGRTRTPMIPLDEAHAIAGRGLEDARPMRPNSKRQVLVMPAEVLDAFGLEPGVLRENITTRGVDVMGLRAGDRLRIGGALIEATGECTPCEMLDDIRPGLQEAMQGQRGMLFRVLEGGRMRPGDTVEVIPAAVEA